MRLTRLDSIPAQPENRYVSENRIGIDEIGRVYVFTARSQNIRVLSPDGTLEANWGAQGRTDPHGHCVRIAVGPKGDLYLCKLPVLQHYDRNGNFLAQFTLPEGMRHPADIAIALNGDLILSGLQKDTLTRMAPDGRQISKIGATGRVPGKFSYPQRLHVTSSGDIYTFDTGNYRIQKLSESRAQVVLQGTKEELGGMRYCSDFAPDVEGHLVLSSSDTLIKRSPAGETLWTYCTHNHPEWPGRRIGPIIVDLLGRILAPDNFIDAVHVWDKDGQYLHMWPLDSTVRPSVRSLQPWSVATDPSGNIVIVDPGAGCVVKYDSGGMLLWSHGRRSFDTDLEGLAWPTFVAIDPKGNIWISDSVNDCVIQISHDGRRLRDVRGLPTPSGLACDNSGTLWIGLARHRTLVRLDGDLRRLPDIDVSMHCESIAGLAASSDLGLFIADGIGRSVGLLAADGRWRRCLSLPAGFPNNVAIDAEGRCFVADAASSDVPSIDLSRGDAQFVRMSGPGHYGISCLPNRRLCLASKSGVVVYAVEP